MKHYSYTDYDTELQLVLVEIDSKTDQQKLEEIKRIVLSLEKKLNERKIKSLS